MKYVTYFNFLGIIIQSNLKWENHINAISIEIFRIIVILSKLKNIPPFAILQMLYCNLIVRTYFMEFCCGDIQHWYF